MSSPQAEFTNLISWPKTFSPGKINNQFPPWQIRSKISIPPLGEEWHYEKVAKIQNLGFYKFFPLFEYCNSKIHVNWSMHFYKSYQICKVKIAHLIFIWKISYTWQKTLTLKCQGTPIAFYYMLNKSLLTSPIYGHRYSTLFHQGPSLQGRVLDSTLNDSYSSFHFFFEENKT